MQCIPMVLIACALGGCASSGVGTIAALDDKALSARVAVAATTRAQLVANFGEAAVIRFDSGYEVWVYKDKAGAPKLLRLVPVVGLATGLITERTRELVILLGPDGVVRKFRLTVAHDGG